MKSALEELRARRVAKPLLIVVTEPDPPPFLADFFAEIPSGKPALPEELQAFCYLHRMAATGGMPADKAAQVIEAIHSVADMLPNRHKRRLMLEARLEELEELSDWFLQWTPPQFEAGEDPFAEVDLWQQ